MTKERIAYIDFMKGICILLIAMKHVSGGSFFYSILPNLDIALKCFRVPLYFFLSGVFFKTYEGFSVFARKKVNNLIVTLLFFHFLCCLFKVPLIAIVQAIRPDISMNFKLINFIPPFFTRFWRSAMALWFLVALFGCNILFYFFHKYLNKVGTFIAVFLSSVLGFFLMKRNVMLPFVLDAALVGLPFFWLGSFVKQLHLLESTKYDRWGYWTFIPCLVFVYFFSGKIDLLCQIVPNYFQLYFVPFVAILSLFWICKNLHYVPLICYYGRYSVIILGTHQVLIAYVYFILRGVYPIKGNLLYVVIFTIVIFIEYFIIKFMIKYFPRFTAQEEFFKFGWKVK